MKIEASRKFVKLYRQMPTDIQQQARKAIELLSNDSNHPSLHHKKMAEFSDIYEIRVNLNYRITYSKIDDTAILRKVGTHDLLRNP